ncbi:MAG: Rpn family recombination-promoting nuclease/putative transposase [Niabella sp.]|nr:Rpn family recombination-promoting nuclease/putative transposase [Niabella sp.]
MSNKKVAVDYFKNYLPATVSKKLNFSTLTQLPDTYLSDALKKTMSDIVYSCRRKGSKKHIKVSLLIEHKSYPDQYTPVQIGGYIFSALQKQLANKEPLSLVIPVLLYHGKGRWQYRTLADLFEETDPEWKQYIPGFEFVYNNLGALNDAEVERLNNKFLAASLLTLKHAAEQQWIIHNVVKLLLWAAESSPELQKGFIIYLYSGVEEIDEKLLNLLQETTKKDVMSALDIYIEKGRKKGLEEGRKSGIEEGMEKGKEQVVKNLLAAGKFSVAEIAGFAGVPEAFVKKLRAPLK